MHWTEMNGLVGRRLSYIIQQITTPIRSKFPKATFHFVNRRCSTGSYSVASTTAEAEKYLRNRDVPDSMTSAEYIVAKAIGKKTLTGVSQSQSLSFQQVEKIRNMIEKRATQCPIQYVVGDWDFRELTLNMMPPVFIPRPETEQLVGFVLKHLESLSVEAPSFLEIGPGAGAISLSLLYELPKSRGVAMEKKIEAYNLTTENAAKLNLSHRLTLVHETFSTGTAAASLPKESFDVIVSNPPYIPSSDMTCLSREIKNFEDEDALHGGVDGLGVILPILKAASFLLKTKGSVWLEVDSSHPPVIKDCVRDNPFNLIYVETLSDFRGLPRFCYLEKEMDS